MSDDHPVLDVAQTAPDMDDEFLADSHIIEVTVHDEDDIPFGRKYMMLFVFDDGSDIVPILSEQSLPVTTEQPPS